ncbi:hypothetical protein HOO65_040822 [Ceratocystis lukuohia]|uniref:Uncharacterized protein n=1 Tax=Ceratocystis lukuohia TaxID=2019550 RepID=A0ABR4MJT6_9PEZI
MSNYGMYRVPSRPDMALFQFGDMDGFSVGDHPSYAALPQSRRLLVLETIIQQIIMGRATPAELSLCPRMLNMPVRPGTGVIYAYGVNRGTSPSPQAQPGIATGAATSAPSPVSSFRYRPLLISVRFDAGSCAFARQAQQSPGRVRQLYDTIIRLYRRGAPRCRCKCPFCCRTCGRLADQSVCGSHGRKARVRIPRMGSLMRAFLSPVAIDMTATPSLRGGDGARISSLVSMSPPPLFRSDFRTGELVGECQPLDDGEIVPETRPEPSSVWTFDLALRSLPSAAATSHAEG